MDPNENLRMQLHLAARIAALYDSLEDEIENDTNAEARIADIKRTIRMHASELSEYVVDLNTWLCGGGFLPDRWER